MRHSAPCQKQDCETRNAKFTSSSLNPNASSRPEKRFFPLRSASAMLLVMIAVLGLIVLGAVLSRMVVPMLGSLGCRPQLDYMGHEAAGFAHGVNHDALAHLDIALRER